MGVKDKFTPEEWRSLLSAPLLAAQAVAGAAPSKRDDFIREMAAVGEGVAEGERQAAGSSLLASVIAEIVADAEDGRRGATERVSSEGIKDRALEACRAAAAALAAKADAEEAYEYKRWVLVVAERVASAAKEGGVFGYGGEQVSGGEVAAINEIGEALAV